MPEYRLSYLLEAAGLAQSTWYDRQKRDAQPVRQDPLCELIILTAAQHKRRYGYRRITSELKMQGHCVNHKKVSRLMAELDCGALVRRKKYHSWQGRTGLQPVGNLLNRGFSADAPGLKLVTDVTEFRVGESKLYLSPVMDLYNREIVAMSMASRPTYALAARMLDALLRKGHIRKGGLLHSDQGWMYQMQTWKDELEAHDIRQSMSRRGNCLDNAAMESFFAVLKTEMFYGRRYESVKELEAAIACYVDYYNNDRIKMGLGGLSPVNYRTQSQSTA